MSVDAVDGDLKKTVRPVAVGGLAYRRALPDGCCGVHLRKAWVA